jgi:hypothetical protein
MTSFNFDQFLQTRQPGMSLHARHTVGMLDALDEEDVVNKIDDGLPLTLSACVQRYGNTYFKLKLSGDMAWDLDRLTNIACVLDRNVQPYYVTLDGNEQYVDVDQLLALWHKVASRPVLARLVASTLMIEQPIGRASAFEKPVGLMSKICPVIIDESDGKLDAFPVARARGYCGVSSKSCKGIYKSLINAARCELWNGTQGAGQYFMSAEDLITQGGLSVQQDLTLASFLGITHIERNGHHYVSGLATCGADEGSALAESHPDLYDKTPPRLRIVAGRLSVQSCAAASGFATSVVPRTHSDARMTGIQ